jgi:Uma2 family endonuclease
MQEVILMVQTLEISLFERALTQAPLRKFTPEEYHRMGETGILKDERVELIDGEVVAMFPIGPEHSVSTMLAYDRLKAVFRIGYCLWSQQPLTLPDSEVQPDIAVVKGMRSDFIHEHPKTAVLVIEVANTSLEYDRKVKSSLYARAGIKDYWIVNLLDRRLEVYREPAEMPGEPYNWGYKQVRYYTIDEYVSPLEKPKTRIKVRDLFA